MKLNKLLPVLAASLGLFINTAVFAATGGGATIHNAASLSFNGGQVTAQVNVSVRTIGSVPTFEAINTEANSGDSVTVTYTITSNSNGADTYDLAVSSTDTDVSAPSSLSIVPQQVHLGASVTSQASTPGTIYIAAGSETDLVAGDTVRLNIGGTDFLYTITSVTPGTPSFTVGNTTTAETPTALVLAPEGISPAILAGNIPLGTQVGEVREFEVQLTAGNPTTPGVDGQHELEISGTTGWPGAGGLGDVVIFTDPVAVVVTVLSGEATLIKVVRNVTEGGVFASTGVTAKSGDVLEYRLTAGTIIGQNVTSATLTDSIPEHATYIANSTTLNGAPVADVAGTSALVSGLQVNSTGGAAGEILDGETAVILFQVNVD